MISIAVLYHPPRGPASQFSQTHHHHSNPRLALTRESVPPLTTVPRLAASGCDAILYDLDRGFVLSLAHGMITSRSRIALLANLYRTSRKPAPQQLAACRKRLRLALTRGSVPPLTPVSHISTAVLYHNFMHPVSHCITVLYHLHRRPPHIVEIPHIYAPPTHPVISTDLQTLCQPTVSSATCTVSQHPVSASFTVLYHTFTPLV